MKKSLLILAMDHDIHADAIHHLVQQNGYTSYRLDPEAEWPPSERPEAEEEWLPSGRLRWSLSQNGHSSSLTWYDQRIDLAEIGAVFCRNFQFAKANDNASIETHLKFAEMGAGLYGLFRTLDHCFWMNPPWLEDLIDNKRIQGRDAVRFGLNIPKTLVTNDEASAKKFIESCPGGTIIKQVSEIGLIDDNPKGTEMYGFYTSLVTEKTIKHLHEVTNAPCLFQENIPKKADIRVTVVGDKIFSHAINSQSSLLSKIDFRKEIELPFENFDFPEKTATALLKMIQSWGMIFATCDFVLNPEDKLIFLEANVTGNWLWLEDIDNHPILDEIIRLLSSKLND